MADSTRRVSVRLSLDDAARVKAELREVGETGQRSLERIQDGADKASRALSLMDVAVRGAQIAGVAVAARALVQAGDALIRPETIAAWRALEHLGLTDALRALHPGQRTYTYWDYDSSFDANAGMRIDHALLSPELAERLVGAPLDVVPRAEKNPPDHTPVVVELI